MTVPLVGWAESFGKACEASLTAFEKENADLKGDLKLDQIQPLYNEFMDSVVGYAADPSVPFDERNSMCFLRALWVHMRALELGIPDSSIRKFVLDGSEKSIAHESPGLLWLYHIVTAIKATDGEWYVFDAEFSAPMKASAWLQQHIENQEKFKIDPNYKTRFTLSVRPSHQYTFVDAQYNKSIELGKGATFLLNLMRNDNLIKNSLLKVMP